MNLHTLKINYPRMNPSNVFTNALFLHRQNLSKSIRLVRATVVKNGIYVCGTHVEISPKFGKFWFRVQFHKRPPKIVQYCMYLYLRFIVPFNPVDGVLWTHTVPDMHPDVYNFSSFSHLTPENYGRLAIYGRDSLHEMSAHRSAFGFDSLNINPHAKLYILEYTKELAPGATRFEVNHIKIGSTIDWIPPLVVYGHPDQLFVNISVLLISFNDIQNSFNKKLLWTLEDAQSALEKAKQKLQKLSRSHD